MRNDKHATYTPVAEVAPVMLSKAGIARAFDVSERTVGNWQHNGVIPFLRISSRFTLFDVEAVRAALNKHYEIRAKAKTKAGVGRC